MKEKAFKSFLMKHRSMPFICHVAQCAALHLHAADILAGVSCPFTLLVHFLLKALMVNRQYGFPVELTEEYAEDENMAVDHEGFEEEMNQQRERARNARQDVGSMQVQGG